MDTRKKIITLIIALILTIIVSIFAMVVILVVSTTRASSNIKAQFTATDVVVDIEANIIWGGAPTIAFTRNGVVGGESTIYIDEINPQDTLSQPNGSTPITLNATNSVVVFEYVFFNYTEVASCKVELLSYPGKTSNSGVCNNISLTYYYSDRQVRTKEEKLALQGEQNYTDQIIQSNSTDNYTKFIYVIASVVDKSQPAKLQGSFEWALSRV